MRAIVTGECLGVTEEQRGQGDRQFTLVKIHLVEGVDKVEVEKTRDFDGALPQRGEIVAVEVSISPWSTASGAKGLNIKGLRRVPEVEELLATRYAAS